MKYLVTLAAFVATCASEAALPIAAPYLATAGLYRGGYAAAPYAAAYNNFNYAYGAPITALNARVAPAPIAAAPIAHVAAPIARVAAAPVVAAAPIARVAAPVVAAAPVAYAAAPVAAAPGPVSSQFQAQDEYGNIAYGYNNINSAKHESGNALGGVQGSYSYVDEAGSHTVNYIADDLGFRVAASNLPVAPVYNGAAPVAPVYTGVAPVAVVDTPEVAAAKADFFAAYHAQQALHRKRRSVFHPHTAGIATSYAGLGFPAASYAGLGYANAGYAGFGYPGYGYSALNYAAPIAADHGLNYAAPIAADHGLAYSAPVAAGAAAREAVLETVKLNPGHAVAYRVY